MAGWLGGGKTPINFINVQRALIDARRESPRRSVARPIRRGRIHSRSLIDPGERNGVADLCQQAGYLRQASAGREKTIPNWFFEPTRIDIVGNLFPFRPVRKRRG